MCTCVQASEHKLIVCFRNSYNSRYIAKFFLFFDVRLIILTCFSVHMYKFSQVQSLPYMHVCAARGREIALVSSRWLSVCACTQ